MSPTHALLILAALCAIGYLPLAPRPPSGSRTLVKTVPLLAFTLIAQTEDLPLTLISAFLACALGDFFLARKSETSFLGGLIAFAVGHVLFAATFGLAGGLNILWPVALALVLNAALAERWLIPFTGGFRWPVRAYILLISLMALAAAPLWTTHPMAVLGALIFMASDLILAVRKFRLTNRQGGATKIADYVVWVSYIAAQTLILFAFLSAPT